MYKPFVTFNNKDYTMVIGSFEWKEEDFEAEKLGTSDMSDLADKFETLEVEKEDKIKIEIENNPSLIIVNQENEDDTIEAVDIQDNEITIPSEEGILYI